MGPPFHSRYGNPSLPCPFCLLPCCLAATHDNRLAGSHVVGGRGEEATTLFTAFGYLKRCMGMSSSLLSILQPLALTMLSLLESLPR
jgi:hypothetical protein